MPNQNTQRLDQFPPSLLPTRDAIGRLGAAYGESLRKACVAITPIMERFAADMGRGMRALDDAFWQIYRAAGAPYGDTDDGRQRWFHEEGQRRARAMAAEDARARAIPLHLP